MTGTVKRIARDDEPDKIVVELSGNLASEVRCIFDKKREGDLKGVAVGQSVTVRGKCEGKVNDSVKLEGCAIAEEDTKRLLRTQNSIEL